MEKIKSVNTNYIYKYELENQLLVGNAFEASELDYLYVKNSDESVVGICYLEDFCNSNKIEIHEDMPPIEIIISEEQRLLDSIKSASDDEITYIREKIIGKFGFDFVFCSEQKAIAYEIADIIFGDSVPRIQVVNMVRDLKTDYNVVFLSFKKIKLYRKMYSEKIRALVALRNIVLDSRNRTVFREKYSDLFEYFGKMQIGYLYGIIPEDDTLTCLSQRSLDRIAGFGKADYEFYEELLGKCSGDYFSCLEQNKLSRVVSNGIYKTLVDCSSDFYNVVGGMRVTTDQPNKFENTIYVFGPCTARGAMVEDKNTIASILQRKVNKLGLPYNVMNCGVGGGSDLENTYRYVVTLPIKPNDYVVLIEEGKFLEDTMIDGENIIRLSDGFNQNKLEGEWFLDRPAHCNTAANGVISNQILEKLLQFTEKRKIGIDTDLVRLFKGKQKIFEDSEELKEYISSLKEQGFVLGQYDVVGSIAMHCNPMTKGHKYLIETALKMVDFLYVFILSEDNSELPFKLRKELLLYEVKEYSNIRVFDCGEFMASTMTFPDYFTKEKSKYSRVDASKDILTFGQHVAPALNITKRFIGTEHRDFVTRQYNSQLKMLLPMYGIEVFEIERMKNSIGFISAYTTRELIKKGDWDGVSDMVTENTLVELKRFYGSEKRYE